MRWLYFGSGYSTGAVRFDGTNDYMERGAGLTGAADSQSGTVSMWLRFHGGNGATQRFVHWTGSTFLLEKQSDNTLRLSGTAGQNVDTLATFTAAGGGGTHAGVWTHVAWEWDASTIKVWVNGADNTDTADDTAPSGAIDHTVANHAIGAEVGGGSPASVDIADLVIHTTQRLDLSANIQHFYLAGNPVEFVGTNGPFSSQPIIRLRRANGAAATTFATNLGGGGNFAITGALDDPTPAPNSPSSD